MASLFKIARNMEAGSTTDEQRAELKEFVRGLVGYPCKIACKRNNGSVDIYVYSETVGAVTDWLELQSSGAIGVIFEFYPNPDDCSVSRVDVACENYNDSISAEFEESDSDEEGDDENNSDSSD
jgi:hypothetical protein